MAIDFRIRFPVQDAELSALHAWAFTGSPPRSDLRVAPWRARLDRHSLTWVGAFDGDVLVGFVHACWDGGEHAFLLDTVVAPTHRHRGVGTTMVRLLVEHTTRSGCTWLHVDHEPHLDHFYRAAGFEPTPAGVLRLSAQLRSDRNEIGEGSGR